MTTLPGRRTRLAMLIPAAALLGAGCQATRMSAPAQGAAAASIGAADLRPGQSFRDCPDCPEMVVIPAGSFTMGSTEDEPGRFDIEGPQVVVSVRQFAVGKFHVSRGEWAAFGAATNRDTGGGCEWSGIGGRFEPGPNPSASWRNLGFPQEDNHPVVCVGWNDAQDYLRWLSERTGHDYRLLTEAEWEYAARAGATTPYFWGTAASHQYANYGADDCCSGMAAGRDQWVNTSPVGSFPPNAFGLYDMHGNAMQWVQDCFAPNYSLVSRDGSAYEVPVPLVLEGDAARFFPMMAGKSSCTYRMLRGGDWGNPPEFIRAAFRNFAPPPGWPADQEYRTAGAGFRVARTLE